MKSPRRIKVSCAAYISKYLRKMEGWFDLHLALLWSGKCRMYGFSRGFWAKIEKAESEWERWQIIETSKVEVLESSLMKYGFVIDVTGPNRGFEASSN